MRYMGVFGPVLLDLQVRLRYGADDRCAGSRAVLREESSLTKRRPKDS
jgi:hypothetical protein